MGVHSAEGPPWSRHSPRPPETSSSAGLWSRNSMTERPPDGMNRRSVDRTRQDHRVRSGIERQSVLCDLLRRPVRGAAGHWRSRAMVEDHRQHLHLPHRRTRCANQRNLRHLPDHHRWC